jgi:DNA-binding transcriptional LysR family regulator
MDDFRQGRQGKLRIAATYLPANFLLPQLIVKFKQMYSQVEIHLMTLNNSNALDKLKNFEADIAIIGGEVEENPELSRQNWIEDECWFIAPSDHPYAGQEVSFRTLMAEPFIMREEGSYMRKKLLALCQLHSVASPRTAIQWTGSQETIRSVMAGYGITFVSSLEVREEIRRGKIARVLVPDIQASNPISIYFRREGSLSLPASNLNIFLNEENVLAKF